MSDYLRNRCAGYYTADLMMPGVDFQVDMTTLPFENSTYDLVYASHVLEHIIDDAAALREVNRVLRPGGIAILPVPIVADKTVDFGAPDPDNSDHVRAPGPDYFQRYEAAFPRVDVFRSGSYPPEYRVLVEICEDEPGTPQGGAPGAKRTFEDYVPVCYKLG